MICKKNMFYSIFLCVLRGIVCKNKGIINPISPIRLIGHMRPTCMVQIVLGNYKSKKSFRFCDKNRVVAHFLQMELCNHLSIE